MQIINPSYEILTPINGVEILKFLEKVGRVCYKSEEKITDDSYIFFISKLIDRGHEAMLEHFSISVKFICDRGVSHELVRHRLASFAQESTRYCNYGKNDSISVINPLHGLGWNINDEANKCWVKAMHESEVQYLSMIQAGVSPQEARSVLPNSLKTEIIVTANLREWRHILSLRAAKTAHPQMRELMVPLFFDFYNKIPVIFNDLFDKLDLGDKYAVTEKSN